VDRVELFGFDDLPVIVIDELEMQAGKKDGQDKERDRKPKKPFALL
jgi:hypothetical protein